MDCHLPSQVPSELDTLNNQSVSRADAFTCSKQIKLKALPKVEFNSSLEEPLDPRAILFQLNELRREVLKAYPGCEQFDEVANGLASGRDGQYVIRERERIRAIVLQELQHCDSRSPSFPTKKTPSKDEPQRSAISLSSAEGYTSSMRRHKPNKNVSPRLETMRTHLEDVSGDDASNRGKFDSVSRLHSVCIALVVSFPETETHYWEPQTLHIHVQQGAMADLGMHEILSRRSYALSTSLHSSTHPKVLICICVMLANAHCTVLSVKALKPVH